MPPDELLALRRVTLAVSVLDDVDLVPSSNGVLLTGDRPVEVPWLELRRALAGADPASDLGRVRVAGWLRGRRLAADLTADQLAELARPVGLPVGHLLHPGAEWVRHRVLGDSIEVGLGFLGVAGDPDEVVVVPSGALTTAGIAVESWWPAANDYLERMGAVAAGRVMDTLTLRPIGDCDVVTLLASRTLRRALCDEGSGLRTAAVPMRRRGWLDLRHIDAAFTTAAAAATAARERGFDRPLLLTADEVTMAAAGGRPAEIVLRDPVATTPRLRPVPFR